MIALIVALAAIAALVYVVHVHSKERQTLLDRIQAPQTVIAQRVAEQQPELLVAVHPDLDSEYWENKGVEVPH